MSATLKYLTALLGLWLVIEASVFPSHAVEWISFATAILITLVAMGDAVQSVVRRRFVAAGTATATLVLAGFLIIASVVLVHASTAWLMAVAGGVIEFLALSELVLPASIRLVTFVPATTNGRSEQPIRRTHAAT